MSNKSRFRPNTEILEAEFVARPAFVKNQRHRGVKRAGITFEKKVGDVLENAFGLQVVHGAWIKYVDGVYGERCCSPDYLVIDVWKGLVTIVECKLSHTKDAWIQINDVYTPVVRKLFPNFEVRGIEVCKNFERSKPYPVTPNIVCGFDRNYRGGDNVLVLRSL